MSLVRNHNLITARKAPSLIRGDITVFNKTTPFNMTLGATPTQGALMVIVMGAHEDKDFTISGWAHSYNGSGANGHFHVFSKIAGAGESTTVNVGWTSGGTSAGTVMYYEMSGVREVLFIGVSALTSQGSATTHQWGSHIVPQGVFEIQMNHKPSGTQTWSINDGYTIFTGSSTVANSAYKSYPFESPAVNPTWTFSSAGLADMIYIHLYGH